MADGASSLAALESRSSGSSFDQWLTMGAVELRDGAELANLAARSTPAISKYPVSVDDGVLRLDAMLDMLEVRLITVKNSR